MYWIAFGDVHEATDTLGRMADLPGAEGVIITGDLTNRGSERAADEVINAVAALNSTVLAQPGNMDTEVVEAYLQGRDMDIHLKVRELAPGLGLMGVGYSSPTPFGTPGEVPESTIAEWLDETFATVTGFDKLIIAIHEPPHGTKLDMIGQGQHVGSEKVRDFIERAQPDVVLTGHIHESMGVDMLGKTTVINPGMVANGGYVRIEYTDGELSAELLNYL